MSNYINLGFKELKLKLVNSGKRITYRLSNGDKHISLKDRDQIEPQCSSENGIRLIRFQLEQNRSKFIEIWG